MNSRRVRSGRRPRVESLETRSLMDGGSDIGDLTIAVVDGNEVANLFPGTVMIGSEAQVAMVSIVPNTSA